MNSFTNLNPKFANMGIHFAIDEVMKFRAQLTKRTEFKGISGWTDEMNRYMMAELEKIYHTLTRITYNPSADTQEELEAQAKDTGRTLESFFDATSLRHDNILGPTPLERELEYDFSGTDPDYPQPTKDIIPNDVARNFIQLMDRYVTELSRLDSRHQNNMITAYEGTMMREQYLDGLMTICKVKGGEVNKSDIPSGVQAKDEPNMFQG